MKKKISTFFLTLVLCFGMMKISDFAASTSQDGLEVTLTTAALQGSGDVSDAPGGFRKQDFIKI